MKATTRTEGILPALETAHAIAALPKLLAGVEGLAGGFARRRSSSCSASPAAATRTSRRSPASTTWSPGTARGDRRRGPGPVPRPARDDREGDLGRRATPGPPDVPGPRQDLRDHGRRRLGRQHPDVDGRAGRADQRLPRRRARARRTSGGSAGSTSTSAGSPTRSCARSSRPPGRGPPRRSSPPPGGTADDDARRHAVRRGRPGTNDTRRRPPDRGRVRAGPRRGPRRAHPVRRRRLSRRRHEPRDRARRGRRRRRPARGRPAVLATRSPTAPRSSARRRSRSRPAPRSRARSGSSSASAPPGPTCRSCRWATPTRSSAAATARPWRGASRGPARPGIIVADLTPDEGAPFEAVARAAGLAVVYLVAPTTPPDAAGRDRGPERRLPLLRLARRRDRRPDRAADVGRPPRPRRHRRVAGPGRRRVRRQQAGPRPGDRQGRRRRRHRRLGPRRRARRRTAATSPALTRLVRGAARRDVTIALLGVPTNSSGRPTASPGRPGPARRRLVGALRGRPVVDLGDVQVDAPSSARGPGRHHRRAPTSPRPSRASAPRPRRPVRSGHRPLVVGGDCPVLIGALAGCADVSGTPPGLLFVDGHEDAWPPHASTTGEAADMELGLLLGRRSTGSSPRCAPQIPELDPARVAILGPAIARSSTMAGVASLDDTVPVLDDAAVGPTRRALPSRPSAGSTRRQPGWWLHVDLDVLSTAALPAVDYQQPGGCRGRTSTELTARPSRPAAASAPPSRSTTPTSTRMGGTPGRSWSSSAGSRTAWRHEGVTAWRSARIDIGEEVGAEEDLRLGDRLARLVPRRQGPRPRHRGARRRTRGRLRQGRPAGRARAAAGRGDDLRASTVDGGGGTDSASRRTSRSPTDGA